MTRVAEIADYLLSTGIGDTEQVWRNELVETIVTRWPNATEEDLTAAFQIAVLESQARAANLIADKLDGAARALVQSIKNNR